MNLREQINLHQIQLLHKMLQLSIDLTALISTTAPEFCVEELEVGEVETVLLLEVDALHPLVALHQLRLDVHGLARLRHCLTRLQLAATAQLLPHLQQVRVKSLARHSLTAYLTILGELLAEEIVGEFKQRFIDVLCGHLVDVISGWL